MKRISLIMACAILIISCLIMPTFASESVTVSVNDVTAFREDTVTFTASLGKQIKVGSGSVVVSYNESALELVSGAWSLPQPTDGTMFITNFNKSLKKGAFAYDKETEEPKVTGAVFSVKFKVKDTAKFETSEVKLTVSLFDENNNPHTVTNKAGRLTVACSHKFTIDSPTVCTVCGYNLPEVPEHSHNFSDKWSSNSSGHYHSCSGCDVSKDFESHKFDGPCDESCSVCGYTRGSTHTSSAVWNTEADKHWRVCKDCGIRVDEGEHIPGPAPTENSEQKCVVCAYVLAPALDHVHVPTEEFFSDETHHWNGCHCDMQVNKEEHKWDEEEILLEPTYKKEGKRKLTCSICGATKTEVLSKLPPPTLPEKTTVAITTVADTDDTRTITISCSGSITGASAALVAIGALGIAVVAKKKNEE